MQLMLDIPDSLGLQLAAEGKDPARLALEALAVEGYRTGKLSENDVRVMLGYGTPMQVHTLLAEHGTPLNYTVGSVEQDITLADELARDSLAA